MCRVAMYIHARRLLRRSTSSLHANLLKEGGQLCGSQDQCACRRRHRGCWLWLWLASSVIVCCGRPITHVEIDRVVEASVQVSDVLHKHLLFVGHILNFSFMQQGLLDHLESDTFSGDAALCFERRSHRSNDSGQR